jgi:HEAT repeats
MTMPYAVIRVIALSSLIFTTSSLFYTSAQGQAYSVNGAQIEVSLAPEKSVIMLGEPIHLSFIVRNLSGTDLCFSEGGDYRNRLGRPESYDVRAVRSDGNQVIKQIFMLGMAGVVGAVEVPVGGAATRHLFLPHWAPFVKTGIYTITCKRTLEFLDLDAEGFHSNGISVTVQTSVQIEVVESNHEKMGEIIEKLGAEMLAEDEEKARLAALSLNYINDERAVPYFVKAIDSGANSLVCSSLRSLSKYSADSAIEGIKKGMKASPKEMRRAGNSQSAISMAESVRLSAAIALKDSKHPDAIPLLLSMRKDSYWGVRLTVVHALCESGTPEAMEILQDMSKDENKDVSQEAIRYLSAKEKK